ncbi:GNAT family N-acetyltransferase [Macrococcoides caseolyticum]|uniref:N-acetyltransferase domain-containing protein n=1 Tax=Macrococcus caseolyticus (strain JCSC5402) TaxID=458233 RepID=B9EC61_MACCJ|nr:GNAT family N-acetyltransferase [Macrococcus caseolyticus]BAH18669.1 conserved hypothetical protein [Macrococcus caseolyticus JCSC5402]
MTIEKLSNDSIFQFISFLEKSFKDTYQNIYPIEYIEKIINDFYSPDNIVRDNNKDSEDWQGYYVYLENNKIVGAIAGGQVQDNIYQVFMLYVHPDFQSRGIGTELLDFITNKQIQYNATTQIVNVSVDNKSAIDYYEYKKFKKIKVVKNWFLYSEYKFKDYRYSRSLKI